MTVVVYLRSSFGFAYLRPKSVFLAFSWATILFDIYAWNEPRVWAAYWPVCLFTTGAVLLYCAHLLIAFFGQLYGRAKHDNDSGTSHVIRIARLAGKSPTPLFEMNLHLWFEPAAVFLFAGILRVGFSERHLSTWLFPAAVCLTLKEAQNYWSRLRQRKRQEDIFGDTEDAIDPKAAGNVPAAPPKATRQARTKRARAGSDQEETRYAEILRLLPPFGLDQAEENYRRLVKDDHPDTHDGTTESNARTAELNEAIEFFRARLGG